MALREVAFYPLAFTGPGPLARHLRTNAHHAKTTEIVQVLAGDELLADAFSDVLTVDELEADKQMLLDLTLAHFAGGA